MAKSSKSSKLSADVKLLLAFDAVRKVSDLYLSTFLVSFIMRTAVYEIISVSMYQLFHYAAIITGFVLIASWVKRKNKILVFGFNLIPKIILLVLIASLHGNVAEYVIPLGLLIGINSAFYWLPMHTMIGEKVGVNNMTKFTGYKNAISGATKILAPVLLGLFITVGSYEQMAVVLLGLCVVEFIMMFFLTPSQHRSKERLDLRGFFNCMMRFPIIRKLFSIEVMRGFTISGTLATVMTMYTVYMFKTDLNLGFFTTLFAVFSIITSYFFGKYAKKSMFPRILFVASMASLFSLAMFVIHTSQITFLIYNLVYSTGMLLLLQISDINAYNLSNAKCVTRDHKTEYFVFRESALAIGRIVGFVVLMYIGVFGGYEYLRYYLIVLTIAILLMGYWSIRINKFIKG